jgi:L,D-transpeptidase catalytic domain/Putative peptidoglycan binding domain
MVPFPRFRPGRLIVGLGVVAAFAAFAALAGCGASAGGVTEPHPASPTVASSQPAPGVDGPSAPATVASPPAVATATAVPTPSSGPSASPTGPARTSPVPTGSGQAAVLRPGDHGREISDLQRRLAAAGYWLGSPDGIYGLLTQQAVLALQKAAGIGLDGLAGPATIAALRYGVRPQARSRAGRLIEVDVARQLLLVVRDGAVQQVFNTSTGTDQKYVVDGRRYLADTPKGTWRIFRQVDGVDHGPLGDLYRPKYFHTDGIAIHGYASVPARAASHGCVRVTNAAMDWLWSSGAAPVGTAVLVR